MTHFMAMIKPCMLRAVAILLIAGWVSLTHAAPPSGTIRWLNDDSVTPTSSVTRGADRTTAVPSVVPADDASQVAPAGWGILGRQQAANCPTCPPSATSGAYVVSQGCEIPELAVYYPDEYLCDGGDQNVHVTIGDAWEVYGLDLEDTVAHYDTVDGRTVVAPSNRVCIYAPRFAAVRQVVMTSEDERLLTMEALEQPLPAVTDEASRLANLVNQPLPTLRDTGLRGPLGLLHRSPGVELANAQPVRELVGDFEAYEDFSIIRLGIHRLSQRAEVEKYVTAALEWTEDTAPEVVLDAEPAVVDTSVKTTGLEYQVSTGKPRIRVVKLASTPTALPGEEVNFTLRFDNVGEQTIGNVTIMDNLTTRLEYVPDSAECDLEAEFFTQENQGESLTLRWEIRDPIKPGEGGIIRFRCRVR